MANEWRDLIYISPDCVVTVSPGPPGVPRRGTIATPGKEARAYWQIREGWRTLTAEDIEALYAKWLPKRDAILGKEEYLGKSRTDWERFYLALADERAARDYAAGKVSAAFGLDGKELLKAMMAQGGSGVAG